MKQERLQLLFKKYTQDSLTPDEAEELEKYIDDTALGLRLQKSIREELANFDKNELADEGYLNEIVDNLESKVLQRINTQEKTKIIGLRPYWRYAAAVVMLFSAGLLIYSLNRHTDHTAGLSSSEKKEDILPGTNKATLVLSTGKIIHLSEKMEGISVKGNLIRYNNGDLLLDDATQQQLTLVVPRKGKYQLKLSDGTKVWLNAASSLKYPSTFRGKERIVEVQGEAYFEVQHDSEHPFIVKSAGQTIKVLGTAFNVNSYNNNKSATTLINGRIALTTINGLSKILAPGDQAITKGEVFTISKVNTQDYIAWKEDLIVLNDQDIYDIFQQLERWYDVEFVNMGIVSANKKLSGEIPRNTQLSAILQALEEQIHVKFEINGRRIMIKT